MQKQAEEISKELNNAYEINDLERVNEILSNLKKGILSFSKSNKIDNKEILKMTINNLRKKVSRLEKEIIAIKESDTYKTISSIEDWNLYFIDTKEKLISELEGLRSEVIV